jgi:hypothetical protein
VYGSHEERERLVCVSELVVGQSVAIIVMRFRERGEEGFCGARRTYLTGYDGEFGREQWRVWCEASLGCGRVVGVGCLQE